MLNKMREKKITLVGLRTGEKGIVKHFLGKRTSRKKLNDLGLREGISVEKISNMIFEGPVIVKVSQTEIAIGYKMAEKIIVEKTDK